jgi:hypothetical protein
MLAAEVEHWSKVSRSVAPARARRKISWSAILQFGQLRRASPNDEGYHFPHHFRACCGRDQYEKSVYVTCMAALDALLLRRLSASLRSAARLCVTEGRGPYVYISLFPNGPACLPPTATPGSLIDALYSYVL